jgi:hypothetical protein
LYNALKIKKIQKNVGKSSPYSKGEADTRTWIWGEGNHCGTFSKIFTTHVTIQSMTFLGGG